jgi:hypothetical protein
MLRKFLLCLVAGGCVPVLAGAAAAESFTTRIEPIPFRGAAVTLEGLEGQKRVRVIRPLPPERQVIINPNGTPLTLGFSDSRVYEYSSSSNYNYNRGDYGGGAGIYSAPLWGGGWGKGGRGFFHNGVPHRGMGGGHHGRGGGIQ